MLMSAINLTSRQNSGLDMKSVSVMEVATLRRCFRIAATLRLAHHLLQSGVYITATMMYVHFSISSSQKQDLISVPWVLYVISIEAG